MDKLLTTPTGNKILSIIWGLGIAALLYKVSCRNGACVVVKVPPRAPLPQSQIFKRNKKCYGLKKRNVPCKNS
jgi:hypothetical protein